MKKNMNFVDPKLAKKIAIILFYIMFLYSGVKKIFNFEKKVIVLQSKTGLPKFVNVIGMILVIILEIIGSIIIITNSLRPGYFSKDLVKLTYISYLIFLIVVTALYHPPKYPKGMIPFLSNVTTFAGLLYLYSDV